MSKGLELKIERIRKQLAQYEERSKILTEKYDGLFKQWNYTFNAAEKKDIERQLKSIEEEIEADEDRYAELEAKLLEAIAASGVLPEAISTASAIAPKTQALLDMLLPYEPQLASLLAKAFNFCCPEEGWDRPQPETLKRLLLALEDMPSDKGSALIKFVAFLSVHPKAPNELRQLLTEWGAQQSADFEALQIQIKQELITQTDTTHQRQSYLFILVENSKITSNEYLVEARIIPDSQVYNPITGEGSDLLSNHVTDRDTFKASELKMLAQGYLEQCRLYQLHHLIVEVFLPLSLLNNEAVDTWEREEYGLPPVRIGCDYRVVVRSSERLKHYGYRDEWEEKWQLFQAKLNHQACDLCADGSCDLGTLLYELGKMETVALKVTKVPEFKIDSVLAALLKTATPIALWVRHNLVISQHQTCEFNQVLGCCMHELPYRVKEKRRETLLPDNGNEDHHIGHHLALLWEDPTRLPPVNSEFATP